VREKERNTEASAKLAEAWDEPRQQRDINIHSYNGGQNKLGGGGSPVAGNLSDLQFIAITHNSTQLLRLLSSQDFVGPPLEMLRFCPQSLQDASELWLEGSPLLQ
jgi:hypothetical protein